MRTARFAKCLLASRRSHALNAVRDTIDWPWYTVGLGEHIWFAVGTAW